MQKYLVSAGYCFPVGLLNHWITLNMYWLPPKNSAANKLAFFKVVQLPIAWATICTNGPFQKNVWVEDKFDIIKPKFVEIEGKLPMKEERDSG